MWHTTMTEHHRDHHTVAAAFWIIAGIIAVIALGDAFVLLAIALATVTTVRWLYRERHRFARNAARNDAEMAPVTQLRPALTRQPDPTSPHTSWRGPSAA
jgi:Flp pilus assembly protein TadB